ncbi:hypothetical protein FQZ97_954820 [compost metagenome]
MREDGVQTGTVAQAQVVQRPDGTGVGLHFFGFYVVDDGRHVRGFNGQRLAEIVLGRSAPFNADGFAIQRLVVGDFGFVMHREHVGNVVIGPGEVENPRAALGRGHRTHGHVPAAVPLACGDHIPVGRDELGLDAESLGDLFGYVDIEAVDFILVVDEPLGWPGRRGGDGQRLAALDLVQHGTGIGGTDEQQRQCGGEGGYAFTSDHVHLHVSLLFYGGKAVFSDR